MAKKTVLRNGKPVAVGTAGAFDKLAVAFQKKFGLELRVTSGYRSRAEQERLYEGYVKGLPGFNLAARPGTSRHETGSAIDIHDSGSTPGVTRWNNARSDWVRANAHKHGFNPNGFTFGEPWHIEYTGDQWKRPPATVVPDHGFGFLNVWGGDGGKGEQSFAGRASGVARSFGKLALATGVELPGQLLPDMDRAMGRRGYVRVAYEYSAFVYVRKHLVKSGRFKPIEQRCVKTKPQGKGRTERGLMFAYEFDGRRYSLMLTHLDVHAKKDWFRWRQIRFLLPRFARFSKRHKVPWPNRFIAADHNTPGPKLIRWMRTRRWVPVVRSKRCAIWRRPPRLVLSRWKQKAPSDHPILKARFGRKK